MDITKLKPSELIRVALSDFLTCDEDPRYVICTNVWHSTLWRSTSLDQGCHVCLAGAVMAKTLDSICGRDLYPESFSAGIAKSLSALDLLRMGEVRSAFDRLGLDYREGDRFDRVIVDWEVSPPEFFSDMYRLVKDLEDAGY